jgi:hypothetical protein
MDRRTDMKQPASLTLLFAGLLLANIRLCAPACAATPDQETIVFLRHGEKPPQGLGQLDCQGLNRALALPPVLSAQFGRPSLIIAPDPSRKKPDLGIAYDYVRPLATIEPTAIALGMPVDASLGESQLDALRQRLESPDLAGATVFVAWEHSDIVRIVRAVIADGHGDPAQAPDWKSRDFDSLYIVRITRAGDAATARFEHGHEGLNGQSTRCPEPAPR